MAYNRASINSTNPEQNKVMRPINVEITTGHNIGYQFLITSLPNKIDKNC